MDINFNDKSTGSLFETLSHEYVEISPRPNLLEDFKDKTIDDEQLASIYDIFVILEDRFVNHLTREKHKGKVALEMNSFIDEALSNPSGIDGAILAAARAELLTMLLKKTLVRVVDLLNV
jgi:hypothetical protein